MSDQARLWTPRFVLLSLANICSSMVFYLLATSMATIAVQQFNASATWAGAATGLYFIGAVGARLVAGPLANRLGLRRLLILSWLGFAAATGIYLLVTNLVALLTLRLLHGVGFGLAATAITSAALSSVPPRRRGEGTGWFTSGMALGTGIGPLIALNLLRVDGGHRTILWLSVAAAVLGVSLVLLAVRLEPVTAPLPSKSASPTERAPLIDRNALPIAAVAALAAVAFSVVLTFLNDFSSEASLQGAAAFFFLVYAAAMLVMRPIMGRLQDSHGDNIVVIPSLTSVIVGLALIASAHSGPILLIGAGLLGFGYGTMVSAGQTIALARATPGHATVAIASFFLLLDLGTGLGPTVLGLFVPVVGFRGLFLIGAGLAFIALIGYLTLLARHPRAPGAQDPPDRSPNRP